MEEIQEAWRNARPGTVCDLIESVYKQSFKQKVAIQNINEPDFKFLIVEFLYLSSDFIDFS